MPDTAEAMTLPDTGEGRAASHGESAQGSADGPEEAAGAGVPYSLNELRYPVYSPLTTEQAAPR